MWQAWPASQWDDSARDREAALPDCRAARAIQTVPPVYSGSSSSRPAMSNDTVVTASRTSAAENPGSLLHGLKKIEQRAVRNLYPFGFPVDPEVKMT